MPSIRIRIKLIANANKQNRMLEMGPGGERIDGLKICKALVEYDELGVDNTTLDGLYRFNEEREPYIFY